MRKEFGAAQNTTIPSTFWCDCTHRIESHQITGGLAVRCLHCDCRNYRPVLFRPGKEGSMRTRKSCPTAIALQVERDWKGHLNNQVIPFRRKGETRFLRNIALTFIGTLLLMTAVMLAIDGALHHPQIWGR